MEEGVIKRQMENDMFSDEIIKKTMSGRGGQTEKIIHMAVALQEKVLCCNWSRGKGEGDPCVFMKETKGRLRRVWVSTLGLKVK